MSLAKVLRGGVGETTVGEKLPIFNGSTECAIKENSGNKLLMLPGVSQQGGSGSTSGKLIDRLAKHVSELAEAVDTYVSETALPFIWEFRADRSMKVRCDEYQREINDLLSFCPQNDPDGILAQEASFPGMEALCFRIINRTQLAILAFKAGHATNKAELESLLKETTYTERTDDGKEIRQVKVLKGWNKGNNSDKAPIWAFGKGYELTAYAFGYYHGSALERLAAMVNPKAIALATAYQTQQKQAVSASTQKEYSVSPDEILFGDQAKVDGSIAVIPWTYLGRENSLTVKREGRKLLILAACGKKPQEDLKEAGDYFDCDEPAVFISHILDEDGEHLCPESNGYYKFNGKVPQGIFGLTRWVRTAYGHCCPSRLHGQNGHTDNLVVTDKKSSGNKRERLVKTGGELLTPEEFFHRRGLGGHDLVFPVGFNHKVYGEDRRPKGEVITLANEATLRLERDETDGKDFIIMGTTESPELANLLQKGGVELYDQKDGTFMFNGRYPDGLGWKELPIPIRNGLSLAFGRLKASEGGDNNR